MVKFKTITLTSLLVFLGFGLIAFYSCDKEPKGGEKIELTIHNPNNFEVRLEIEGVDNCDPDENPNYYKYTVPHTSMWPPGGLSLCVMPDKNHLWGQLNLGGGTTRYTSKLGVRKVKVRAYRFDKDHFDKDNNPGDEVGYVSFKGKFGKKYEWTVGYNNEVKEIVPPPSSSSGGGSGGGDCPGAEAQHYKDLMDNNPTNDCQQIWALQAAWHAYKCVCDNGLANQSDANKMVATLNATRTNIENLYKSGGSGPYTKCGAIPPRVSKCKVK